MKCYEITTTLGTQRAVAHLAITCNEEYPGSVSKKHLELAETIVHSEMSFGEAAAIGDYQASLIYEIARIGYQVIKKIIPD